MDFTSYANNVTPFNPTAIAQAQQNLFNSQLSGQGQQIANDTNQTALQVQKLNNMRQILNEHLNDPNVSQQDLYDSIDKGVKNGSFTLQQAALGKANIAALPDNPMSLHQHLQAQNLTLMNAQQALEATANQPGPDYNQGPGIVTTTRGALAGPTPNQPQQSGYVPLGQSPSDLAQIGNATVRTPTGRTNPDGTPETTTRTLTGTQLQRQNLVSPSNGFASPAPPSFGTRTGPPQALPSGIYNPPRSSQAIPALPPGINGGPNGTTPVDGSGLNGPIPSDMLPPSAAPGVATGPGGMPAMPADTGQRLEQGNAQKALDQKNVTDTSLQKQGLYTVNNILRNPTLWTGKGQDGLNAITGYLTTGGFLDAKRATDNDAITHALAQAMGGSPSDYQAQIAALAGGSIETAKPALQELVQSRLANQLRSDAATQANANVPADQYINARTNFIQNRDVNLWKLDLMDDKQKSAYAGKLTEAQANKMKADKMDMRSKGLLGTNSGSPGATQ